MMLVLKGTLVEETGAGRRLPADAYLIGLKNIPTSVSHQAGFGPASGCLHCIAPYGVMHTWLAGQPDQALNR